METKINAKQYTLLMGSHKTYQQIRIDAGQYKYLAFQNVSPNSITVYEGSLTPEAVTYGRKIGLVTPQTMITLQLDAGVRELTFVWSHSGKESHEIIYLLSNENPNMNGVLGGGSIATVTVGQDNVGLARQTQLPNQLHGDGGLKVHVLNSDTADERFYMGELLETLQTIYTAGTKARLDSVVLASTADQDAKVIIRMGSTPVITAIVPAFASIVVDAPVVMVGGEQLLARSDTKGIYATISGRMI